MAYLIGIDVGTTGAKTILVDEGGQLHASTPRGISAVHASSEMGGTEPGGLVAGNGEIHPKGVCRIAGFA